MQYIQLKVQDASLVPTPEEEGNINYFLDLADNMPKFKTWTGEVLSVGGSTAIDIPTPIVITKGTSNEMLISLTYTGLDLTNKNPEIFLFRWKNSERRKRPGVPGVKKPARWVHPATDNAHSKWSGWSWFNGNHFYKKNVNGSDLQGTITGRITEFGIPDNLQPGVSFIVDFNRYMFRYFSDEENDQVLYDQNFIAANPDISIATTLNSIGQNNAKAKIIKFCFAVAIDNPLATKQNGLCPKLFGPYSEPFYAVIHRESTQYTDIELRAGIINQHQKVYTRNL